MRKSVTIWQALALILVGAIPAWYSTITRTESLRSSKYNLIIEKDSTEMNACLDKISTALQTCEPAQCKFYNSIEERKVISDKKISNIEQFISLHENAQETFKVSPKQDNKCLFTLENLPAPSNGALSVNISPDSINFPTTNVRCDLMTDKSISFSFMFSPLADKSDSNKNGKAIDSALNKLLQQNTCIVTGTP